MDYASEENKPVAVKAPAEKPHTTLGTATDGLGDYTSGMLPEDFEVLEDRGMLIKLTMADNTVMEGTLEIQEKKIKGKLEDQYFIINDKNDEFPVDLKNVRKVELVS